MDVDKIVDKIIDKKASKSKNISPPSKQIIQLEPTKSK